MAGRPFTEEEISKIVEPILLFEQRESDLCTTSRDAHQRGDVDRGCRSCSQRHGRREVSSIASREPEGELRCFLTDALTNRLVDQLAHALAGAPGGKATGGLVVGAGG